MTDWYRIVKLITTLEAEAEQRGDDRASAALREIGASVMEAQPDLVKAEAVREKDRRRKREKALLRSKDSTESAESTESVEKGFVPPDPLSSKRTTEEAKQPAREADGKLIEVLSAALAREMGDLFADADAFVKRREVSTWTAWLREMTSLIGGGSQFIAEDLAQVCRDDAALSRPIGSPKGLRVFLGSAKAERLSRTNPPNLEVVRPQRGSTVAQRTLQNGLDALKDIA